MVASQSSSSTDAIREELERASWLIAVQPGLVHLRPMFPSPESADSTTLAFAVACITES
jgi:hypothetical protein